MHFSRRPGWLLIICCVALCLLLGLAWALDDDGDLSLLLWQTESPSRSPEDISSALPPCGGVSRLAGPAALIRVAPPGLLAAVPGGLCLLI